MHITEDKHIGHSSSEMYVQSVSNKTFIYLCSMSGTTDGCEYLEDILDNNRLMAVPNFYCLWVQPKRTNPKTPASSEA